MTNQFANLKSFHLSSQIGRDGRKDHFWVDLSGNFVGSKIFTPNSPKFATFEPLVSTTALWINLKALECS